MNNLTEEQQRFLQDITEKMSKEDNRATQYPLFYVHDIKWVSVPEGEDWDKIVWHDDDWQTAHEMREDEWDDDAMQKYDDEGFTRMYYRKEIDPQVNVGPFFTEEAAQAHIDANSHHYDEPSIYTWSCWRNDEMQEVLRLLFVFAGKEIPDWYK